MNATTPVSPSRALDMESCWKAFESRDKRFDGRFFTTVKTTRIYCRPGCPARLPRRDNVRFVPTAAAAEEAGYRPCKRCRPDAAPGTPLWSGTTTSVARALRLIEDAGPDESGVLGERGVPALADRLGMTDRHLRRLFAEHLGASPARIVRTRRVHFARRLLDETALPVTRIAYEAGFGSLRAFHTAYKESFGEPPKASRAAEVPRAGGLLTLRLPYRPPYDWNAISGFLAARAIPGVEEVVSGVYRRTYAGTIVSVRPAPRGSALELTMAPAGEGRLLGIVRTVSRVFDVAADPETLRRHFESDAVLGPLVAKRPGLRVPGAFSRFELLVRAVLGQQVSVAAARTFAARLVARWGTPLQGGTPSSLTHSFPEAPALATLASADLASIGLTTRRAETLRTVARAFAGGALPEESPGLDELVERLTALPGIGPWTAQYMALRAWNEPDAFPTGDLGLMAALAKNGVRPTAKELEARAEAWRPFRAYAALHLWTEGAPE